KFIKEDELNPMDTESSTFKLMETGLSDDSSGENFWKNDKDNLWLKWKADANLEKSRHGPYNIGNLPKSTYYDKWGLSVQDVSSDEEFALLSENNVISLKKDLEENFNRMSAQEYVKKRAKSGELPLCKKGNGKSIMVSEFLTEACGRLKLTAEHIESYPDVPEEARVYLKPGANEEGY
ncbi:14778_t:CDS:2, partial [Acaulospora colombiana]